MRYRPAYLRLLPCLHYWLAVQYDSATIVSVCKKCNVRNISQYAEWEDWKAEGLAEDKLKRI